VWLRKAERAWEESVAGYSVCEGDSEQSDDINFRYVSAALNS
jgi:hypothetical protein